MPLTPQGWDFFVVEENLLEQVLHTYMYKDTGGVLYNWILFLADLPSLQILVCFNSSLSPSLPSKVLDVFVAKASTFCVSSRFPNLSSPPLFFFGLSS